MQPLIFSQTKPTFTICHCWWNMKEGKKNFLRITFHFSGIFNYKNILILSPVSHKINFYNSWFRKSISNLNSQNLDNARVKSKFKNKNVYFLYTLTFSCYFLMFSYLTFLLLFGAVDFDYRISLSISISYKKNHILWFSSYKNTF